FKLGPCARANHGPGLRSRHIDSHPWDVPNRLRLASTRCLVGITEGECSCWLRAVGWRDAHLPPQGWPFDAAHGATICVGQQHSYSKPCACARLGSTLRHNQAMDARCGAVRGATMGYAKCIGRVGVLAVALGVGAAVAATPAIGYAAPADSGSSSVDSSGTTG